MTTCSLLELASLVMQTHIGTSQLVFDLQGALSMIADSND